MPIHFFTEEPLVFSLDQEEKISSWLENIIAEHSHRVKSLSYIFCNDDFILNVNKKYLKHDYFTDVITFDQSEVDSEIEGDIFISIDTVRSNAEKFKTDSQDELHRVMVHGLLHLLGMNDKSEEEIVAIRGEEDKHLKILNQLK